MSDKREIRKRIARLEGELAACELPAEVRAELMKRHTAKHYPGPCEVPASVSRVAVVERQAVAERVVVDSELVKLEATLARLVRKLQSGAARQS